MSARPIRPLRRDEIPVATETLAAAFDDDPLFRFFFPGEANRQRFLHWFLRRALEQCAAVDGTFVLEDGGPATGAICVVPPGRWPLSLARRLVTFSVPLFVPTYRLLAHGISLEQRIHALHPRESHAYVYVLGVHPSRQGTGVGGALMGHACALARAEASSVHLETANPVNLPFYRRFGLDVGEELTVGGGPPLWTMTAQHPAGPRTR